MEVVSNSERGLGNQKITPEQALNVVNKYQVEALANVTYEQATKFTSWEQVSVLNDGLYSTDMILGCSSYSTVGTLLESIESARI